MLRPSTVQMLGTLALFCFAQVTLGGAIPSASADISQARTTEQQIGSKWLGDAFHTKQVDPLQTLTRAELNTRGLAARQNSVSELKIRKIMLEKQLQAVIKVRSELGLAIHEILSDPKIDSQTRQAQVSAMMPVFTEFITQQNQLQRQLDAVNAEISKE